MKKLVVIGVPVYQKSLTQYEKISLQQVNKILVNYPRIFIAPNSLVFDYGEEYSNWQIERFEDSFFISTESYSKLLLSKEFYQRFINYKFLLIYQLDAFVFSDQLKKFCDMNYDYIGGPWDYFIKTKKCKNYVGNGGFSLRKISSVINLIEKTSTDMETHIFSTYWNKYEDRFFSFWGGQKEYNFNIPSSKIANSFSFESNVKRRYRFIGEKLPFGCHAWHKQAIEFYAPFIEEFGYELNVPLDGQGNDDENLFQDRCLTYLIKRYIKSNRIGSGYIKQKLETFLGSKDNRHFIFGYGKIGEQIVALLEHENIIVLGAFDNNEQKQRSKKNIIVFKPEVSFIKEKQGIILITTIPYQNVIKNQLIELGLIENIDFIDFISFLQEVMKEYFFKDVLRNGHRMM